MIVKNHTDEMQVRFEEQSRANTRRLSATRNFIAGSVSGMFGCVVGQPLDMIKVRLQVMSLNVQPGQTPSFTGPLDCLVKMIKADGVRSLFRGMLAPILIATPVTALSFYSLSLGKRLQLKDPSQEPTLIQYMNAGFLYGLCGGLIHCPAERLKCILQTQKSCGVTGKKGPFDVLREVYRKEGFRGVFRGMGLTLLRDISGNGAWYLTYEAIQKALRPPDGTRDDVTMASIVVAGGTAGLVLWGLVYPVDVLKTRYQVAPAGLYARGGRDILRHVIQNEGIKALYRGFLPCLVRAPVVHIAIFIGYEFTLKVLNRLYP